MLGFFGRRKQKRIEELWRKARAALATGEAGAALGALDRILSEEAGEAEALLLKSEVLRSLERTDEAEQILQNLGQWPDPQVRVRAALERARVLLSRRNWAEAWRLLPRAAPEESRWRWLEAALRCCYELRLAEDFRRMARGHVQEPTPEELADPRARRAASTVQALMASFHEDESDLRDPQSRARIESHYRKALELWPENEEARSGLEELLAGPAEAEAAPTEAELRDAEAEAEEPAPPAARRAKLELPPEVLEALRLMREGRPLEALPLLNAARSRQELLPELFPRLVLAQLYAKDIDGVEFTCGQWEKWLAVGLEAESPQELALWEAPLEDYLELGDAIGRLQTWRLQRWTDGLLRRGHGGSRCFVMLFQADAELRRLREAEPGRLQRLYHRYVAEVEERGGGDENG
jgi:hypothetical protein